MPQREARLVTRIHTARSATPNTEPEKPGIWEIPGFFISRMIYECYSYVRNCDERVPDGDAVRAVLITAFVG